MTPNFYLSDFALEILFATIVESSWKITWFKLSPVPHFSVERGPQAHLNREKSLPPICFSWEKTTLVVSKANFISNPFNMKHKKLHLIKSIVWFVPEDMISWCAKGNISSTNIFHVLHFLQVDFGHRPQLCTSCSVLESTYFWFYKIWQYFIFTPQSYLVTSKFNNTEIAIVHIKFSKIIFHLTLKSSPPLSQKHLWICDQGEWLNIESQSLPI